MPKLTIKIKHIIFILLKRIGWEGTTSFSHAPALDAIIYIQYNIMCLCVTFLWLNVNIHFKMKTFIPNNFFVFF